MGSIGAEVCVLPAERIPPGLHHNNNGWLCDWARRELRLEIEAIFLSDVCQTAILQKGYSSLEQEVFSMKTQCPHCEAGFKVSADYKGKRAKCPKCTVPFVVKERASEPVSMKETSPRKDTARKARADWPVSQRSTREVKRTLTRNKPPDQPRNKGKKTKVGFSCLVQIAVDSFLLRRMVLPWLVTIFFAICFVRTALFALL